MTHSSQHSRAAGRAAVRARRACTSALAALVLVLAGCSDSHRSRSSEPQMTSAAPQPHAGSASPSAHVLDVGGGAAGSGAGGGAAGGASGGASAMAGAPAERAYFEVWKGEVASPFSGTCASDFGVAEPTGTFRESVVLVLDFDGEGGLVAASALFGGPPQPDVEEESDGAFAANCGLTPFRDIVYPVTSLLQAQSRIRLGFSPLDAYADWCSAQQPIEIMREPMYGGPYACRAQDDLPTVAKALCYGDVLGTCACDATACELEAALVYLDLEREGDRMQGIFAQGSDSIVFGHTRVALRRIE